MTIKESPHALRMLGPEPMEITLHVNGQVSPLLLDPRTSLLDALREHLDLVGTKKGCDQGTCGACTVWIDRRRVLACLTLAITCGQIMSAVALLEEGHASSDAEIGEWMSGNLCRCAAYPNIRAAIREVRDAGGGNHHAAD